jgi:radical SAM protein with 4Fe4S-binding SPASM domain
LGVAKLWRENDVLNSIRENLPHKLRGICSTCMFKNYCLGYCIALTFYENGDLFEGYPFCQQAFEQGLFPSNRIVDHK